MNSNELKRKCAELEAEIKNALWEPDGQQPEPITDGIVNVDEYLSTAPRVLWFMKEPYDDDGGGWSLCENFVGASDFLTRMGRSRATWHPIIYTCYGIQNGFLRYGQIDFIRDDPSIVDAVKKIAIVNIQKMPAGTTSDSRVIRDAFQRNKTLLLKQIACYDPDVLIGASTMHLLLNEMGVPAADRKSHGKTSYVVVNNKLYVDAYHPAQRMFKQEKYVNDLIELVEGFWKSKHLR